MGQNLTGQQIKDTYQFLVQISGSNRDILTDGTGSLITNLDITSSFASQAGTSGLAVTASYALQAGTSGFAAQAGTAGFAASASFADQAGTAGFAVTASYAENAQGVPLALITASISDATITFTKFNSSSFAITVDNVASASYAGTSGYSVFAGNGFPYTGSAQITGSLGVTGSIGVQSGSFNGYVIDNLTTPTASDAVQHVVALSAADYGDILVPDPNTFYIINDATGSLILGNTIVSGSLTVTGTLDAPGLIVASASFANTASFAFQAGTSGFATSASFADQAGTSGFATTSISSSFAQTASFALNATPPFPFTGSAIITGSLSVEGTLVSGLGNASNTVANGGAAIATSGSNADGILTAVIGGFNNDTGNTEYSVIAGGTNNNVADGQNWSFIGGGENNSVNAGVSVVVGGTGNTVGGFKSGIFAGESNTVSNGSAAIIGGTNNTVSHTRSVVIGGNALATTATDQVVVPNLLISASGGGITFPDGTTQTTAGGGGGAAFPYTGSAEITGSLRVIGPQTGLLGDLQGITIYATQSANSLIGDILIGAQDPSINGLNTGIGINNVVIGSGEFLADLKGIRSGSGDSNVVLGGYGGIINKGSYNSILGGGVNTIEISGSTLANTVASYNVIAGGDLLDMGQRTSWSALIAGKSNQIQPASTNGCQYSAIVAGQTNFISGSDWSGIFTSRNSDITFGNYVTIVGGNNNTAAYASATSAYSAMIAGNGNTLSHTRSVVIGGTAISSSKNDEVVVPNLTVASTTGTAQVVINNYAALNFADDTAAAAGNVPLGGVYQNSGALRIRIA